MKAIPRSVAAAYSQAPATHQKTMLEMRLRILEVIPAAEEVMKYGMPTFIHEGTAVAGLLANKNHIGFYPYSGSVLNRLPEITDRYSTTKAAIHVPIGQPMPKSLVKLVVKTRISDCPVVTREKPSHEGQWAAMGVPGAPARRALTAAKITSLSQLSKTRRSEIAALHGMGPKALAVLDKLLKQNKLKWKPEASSSKSGQ